MFDILNFIDSWVVVEQSESHAGGCVCVCGSAADAHAYRHEGSKGSPALHHGLPHATHQLTPAHPDPGGREGGRDTIDWLDWFKPHSTVYQ